MYYVSDAHVIFQQHGCHDTQQGPKTKVRNFLSTSPLRHGTSIASLIDTWGAHIRKDLATIECGVPQDEIGTLKFIQELNEFVKGAGQLSSAVQKGFSDASKAWRRAIQSEQ
jgi:hypothetical protein